MSSQHPNTGNGRKPFPTLRPPSTTASNLANPATPPERATPHRNVQEEFLISTTYSTIAARALSFQGQVLTSVTPLQLAQNGFYYEPRAGNLACCFACQSAKRLAIFKSIPIEEVQELHIADCIWLVIYRDLKHHFENTDTLPHSTTASPSSRESPPSPYLSLDRERFETTTAHSSTQTQFQSTPTVSTIVEDRPNTNLDSCAKPSFVILDSEPQPPRPTSSPQPLQPTPAITSPPSSPQPTYASVLRHHTISKPQSTHLHRRFHDKPPPLQLEKKTRKRSANRTCNKTASVTESLSRFLISALPAFSRFLAEMQPNTDSCCLFHSQIYYSRAKKAA